MSEDDAIAKGRFFGFDALKKTAVFKPRTSTDTARLEAGKSYAYVNGYWGERVALVLDRSKQWNRTQFVPQDAVEYKWGDRRIWGKFGQGPPSVAGYETAGTIKGGWDHEHCEICSAKIAEYAQPYGYVSTSGGWVCEKCYSNYIQPRRVAFIDEHIVSYIRGQQE